MSAEAVGWVYRHSPLTGSEFCVHLAVADSVNDQHVNEFWMSLPKLGKKARVSRASAKRAMDALVAGGFLELVTQSHGGRNLGSTYRFCFPDVAVVFDSRSTLSPRAGSAETLSSEPETLSSEDPTLSPRAAHRTQEEPKVEPKDAGRPFFCSLCGNDYRDEASFIDHTLTTVCPGDHEYPQPDEFDEGDHDTAAWFREHGEAS